MHNHEKLPTTSIQEVPERGMENREQIGGSFLKLEQLAKQADSDPKKKAKAQSILRKTARALLKTAKRMAIGTALVGAYAAVDLEKPEHFQDKNRSRQELKEKGITSEQRHSGYKPGISEILYRGTSPLGYQGNADPEGFLGGFFLFLENKGIPNTHAVQQFVPNLMLGRQYRAEKYEEAQKASEMSHSEEERLKKLFQEYSRRSYENAWGSDYDLNPPPNPEHQKALEDAWRLYLGMPQQHGSFDVSDFKPSKDKEDKYYYKINRFWDSFFAQSFGVSDDVIDWKVLASFTPEQRTEYIRLQKPESGLKGKVELIQKFGKNGEMIFQGTQIAEDGGDVMFPYKVSLGKDTKGSYISYYDKWDLASFLATNPLTRGIGRPFEIYDRLYYDPITFEIVGSNQNL